MSETSARPDAAEDASPAARQPGHHIRRIFIVWLVLSAVLDVLFYTLVGPHVPPGTMTDSASDNQFDFNVLFLIALPVLVGVWTYMAYSHHHLAFVQARGPRAGRRPRGPHPPGRPGRLDHHHHRHRDWACSHSAPCG